MQQAGSSGGCTASWPLAPLLHWGAASARARGATRSPTRPSATLPTHTRRTCARLQSVEARRREALGARLHDPLHLALLKHRVLGLWPASDLQQLHFQRVLGLAPPLEVRWGGGRVLLDAREGMCMRVCWCGGWLSWAGLAQIRRGQQQHAAGISSHTSWKCC